MLHNLKRVEAGLRGEYLGPEIWFEETKNRRERKQGDVEGSVKSKEGVAEEEWQDRGEFERAQEVEAGDIGDSGAEAAKDNAGAVPVLKVPDGGLGKEDWQWMEKPDMENTKREKAEEIEKVKHEFRNVSVMKAPSDTLSKEERKRRKKARREDEKREKAAKQRKRPKEVTVEPMDLDP